MELSVTISQPHKRAELFGAADRNLRRIRDAFQVQLAARQNVVRVVGEPGQVSRAAAVIERLQELLRGAEFLPDAAVDDAIAEVRRAEAPAGNGGLWVFTRDAIIGKTEGQKLYIRAMLDDDLVFCVGPAGTGKTYLAVAVAVHLLRAGRIKRIVLARPAVEAGERLGFLPGDLQAKVNPYLRPLFDAMHDMMTYDQLKRFMVNDVVEVVPLAFMRGRTLSHSVIILDEAQNATPTQMLMFLTRLGQGSKMIVTGDDSQTDLPPNQASGLADAVARLRGVSGVSILRLTEQDIFRHTLVQAIVSRYAESDNRPSGVG